MRILKPISITMGILSLLRVKFVTVWISTLFLLVVVATPQVFSQNRVLHVVLTVNPGPLVDVTRRSMAIELESAGMEVESRKGTTFGDMSPVQVSSMAASTDTQYVALLRCDDAGKHAGYEMALYDGETGRALAWLNSENVPVDLEYDIIVARSARALLAEAGLWFDMPESAQESLSPPAVAEKGFAFSAGIAPVFVTGDASDYLKFGFLASLSFGYRIPMRSATLGLDLFGGAGILYPEEYSSVVNVYLLPFGPSVRMETSSSADLQVGVRVSGGPALIAVRTASEPTLTKMVPYALGGLEVAYHLSHSLLIRLESNYNVFFEEVYPIMAFSPTLALKWQP